MYTQYLPIISIVGTTSVGKSEAALHLARTIIAKKIVEKVFILSADSRQVYADLPILTGADVPEEFTTFNPSNDTTLKYFSHNNIHLFGLLFRKVSEDWSVAQFRELARSLIQKQSAEQAALIVVGGTGLYHQQLLQEDPQLAIPPNPNVRERAAHMQLPELQAWLMKLAPLRYQALNNSDRQNPRRLQRAIEIVLAQMDSTSEIQRETTERTDHSQQNRHVFYGLSVPLALLRDRIEQRVIARFESGAVAEVAHIIQQQAVNPQVHSTLGFSHISDYIAGNISRTECIAGWTAAEFAYSKRQLTWWKKETSLQWFDRMQTHSMEELTNAVIAAYSA